MYAPQYGRNGGKRRAANPFSKPWARRGVKHVQGRMVVTVRPVRLPAPHVSGAVTVTAPNRAFTSKLFYKSAASILGTGKKARPNPVISKAVVAPEMPRLLCAIPQRDKPRSRNDARWYMWRANVGRGPASPRHNKLHMRLAKA